MKTFVVVSDTHGHRDALKRLEPLFAENDYIVHLGDGVGDMRPYLSLYPEKTYVVKGNCDFSFAQEEVVLEAEGMSVLCCHGNTYGVKRGLSQLAARAKQLGCAVALYGHTHNANVERVEGVLCVNPGAVSDYAFPSYAFLVLHSGSATATIVGIK